jgi:hypothetical protein
VYLDIIGEISDTEVIARGVSVKQRAQLNKRYGRGSWRKLKGTALVRLPDGEVVRAELHWYEAHGIGRRRMKIKTIV